MNNSMKSLIVFLSVLVLINFTGCSKDVVKNGVVSKLSDGQITLAVIVEAKEGKEQELKKALMALVEPTRNEKGCIHYVLHTDPKDDSRFMFYENWENVELWNAHLNSAHIKAFGDKAGDLVANSLDVTNWKIYE